MGKTKKENKGFGRDVYIELDSFKIDRRYFRVAPFKLKAIFKQGDDKKALQLDPVFKLHRDAIKEFEGIKTVVNLGLHYKTLRKLELAVKEYWEIYGLTGRSLKLKVASELLSYSPVELNDEWEENTVYYIKRIDNDSNI